MGRESMGMNVVCVGTDPAALYLGILLKRRDPAHTVRFFEAESDAALPASTLVGNPLKPRLKLADVDVQAAANASLVAFDRVEIATDLRTFKTDGLPYATIRPSAFAEALRGITARLGCEFAQAGARPTAVELAGADAIVAASAAARGLLESQRVPEAETVGGTNLFLTFETSQSRHSLAYRFRSLPHGGILHATAWPNATGSTVIVEATADTLRKNNLDRISFDNVLGFCRNHFADELDGARPPQQQAWRPFATVCNQRWHSGSIVLLGSAAYTSHFSIGLDLRSALEDAETLADLLGAQSTTDDALKAFDASRRPKAESLQRAAAASQSWFEHVEAHLDLPFDQFVFSLLTASMRITYARIEKAAPELVRSIDALVAPPADGGNQPPPPMFAPITLRDLTIPNRVVVSPMCMYSSKDGTVNDFQLVHLGSRAVGGAGLVITEMTDVLPEGRISLHCAGMYKPEHVDAWRRIVDFIHQHSSSKVAVQLAHAGRKGSLTRNWEGHQNLGVANWELIAPSAIPFMEGRQTPRAMNRADMDTVREAFVRATEMSETAGFDMIELHFAHGYLISSFISPVSNRRTDEYGGSLANRMRFPLEVFRAVRAAWPKGKPISTRISALDWVEGGTTIEDAIEIARLLHEAGNDILAVSTGGVSSAQAAADGRSYQAVFSDRIRNTLKIPTMSVGGIVSHGDANTIIGAGRADMVALARGYLEDAYFARHAARAQNYGGVKWPLQYRRAAEIQMRGA
jgi:anthraniloyl-CoA monooxygenase